MVMQGLTPEELAVVRPGLGPVRRLGLLAAVSTLLACAASQLGAPRITSAPSAEISSAVAPSVLPEPCESSTSIATEEQVPASFAARDGQKVRGRMAPLPEELLQPAIELPDCPGVQVVEWKLSPGFERTTGPSPRAAAVVNRTCRRARDGFARFLKKKGIQGTDISEHFVQLVSILPAKPELGGEEYRGLNDATYRFASRTKEYDEEGDPWPIWGYHQRSESRVYVMNDVLTDNGRVNASFVTVLAHELFHAMSYAAGVYEQHAGDKTEADETLAIAFTVMLGLGE